MNVILRILLFLRALHLSHNDSTRKKHRLHVIAGLPVWPQFLLRNSEFIPEICNHEMSAINYNKNFCSLNFVVNFFNLKKASLTTMYNRIDNHDHESMQNYLNFT